MIPKVFHTILLNPDDLRFFEPRWTESWRERHPDWRFVHWTAGRDVDELVAEADEHSRRLYRQYDTNVMKGDLLRLLILQRLGGVYVDLDYECFRPIDGLLVDRGVVLAEEKARRFTVSNAFMASEPGHMFWRHVLGAMPDIEHTDDPAGETGPRLLTQVVNETQVGKEWSRIKIIVPSLLSPYRWQDAEKYATARRETFIDAYAAHRFAGTWRRKEQEDK